MLRRAVVLYRRKKTDSILSIELGTTRMDSRALILLGPLDRLTRVKKGGKVVYVGDP